MLTIGEHSIAAGQTTKINLPVAKLYTDAEVSLPVYIRRSLQPGPIIFISAAIHGDELNGIEIIRRIIQKKLKLHKGTLIAVPMVNVYGVVNQSRYMPDRRDLNRNFPGSPSGSLTSRIAHLFSTQIVAHCDYGIDLHTGAINRSNLPHIRADISDPETRRIAEAFGSPVILNSTIIDGSLRHSARADDKKILLFEGGEALRFDELSIRVGVKGILNVLNLLGMIKIRGHKKAIDPYIAYKSSWVRANESGIVSNHTSLGKRITKGDVLGEIGSPYGDVIDKIIAHRSGILIGQQNIPLVREGEAMFHIASFEEDDGEIEETIETSQELLFPDTDS